MHDPISDMMVRIKNAGKAGNASTEMPFSKLKESIAVLLFKEGYITSYVKNGKKVQKTLEIGIAYDGKIPKVVNVDRISKLSCRRYFKVTDIKPIKQGYGLLVLSTPKGIMTGAGARKAMVGGEALFKIW